MPRSTRKGSAAGTNKKLNKKDAKKWQTRSGNAVANVNMNHSSTDSQDLRQIIDSRSKTKSVDHTVTVKSKIVVP